MRLSGFCIGPKGNHFGPRRGGGDVDEEFDCPRTALTSGWKRLLLADGPRQSINALVLYSFAYSFGFQTHDIPAYWEHSAITAMLLFAQLATVLIFAGSLILLVAAALLYVPLLCYIQGNLKEYVCHKVDKVRLSPLTSRKELMFSESQS